MIVARNGAFEGVPPERLLLNVPSFSHEDHMPVAGRKNDMACHGTFRLGYGIGIFDP